MHASFGYCVKNAKPINLILYFSISLLSSISWKRWVRTNISKHSHNSWYFCCALLSGCSQFFSKPVALDWCCVSMGWICMCSVGVITIGAQALAIVTIALHHIHHCLLFSYPLWLSPKSLSLLSSTVNIVVNAQIRSIPSCNIVDCCVRCIMKSDLQNIGKEKYWRSTHHKRK